MAIGCSGEAIAAGFEDCVDLIVGGKEALYLPLRLKTADSENPSSAALLQGSRLR